MHKTGQNHILLLLNKLLQQVFITNFTETGSQSDKFRLYQTVKLMLAVTWVLVSSLMMTAPVNSEQLFSEPPPV